MAVIALNNLTRDYGHGKGVYNLSKLAVSGTFGVCYEFVDEAKYIFVPNTTNDSSLNPDEVLTILY